MPVFLKDANSCDVFRCDCCGEVRPRIAMHEHHKVKRASGGKDTRDNIALLDSGCHHAMHQIELALKNPRKVNLVPDLLRQLFPNNPKARQNCLYLATTAALARDPSQPIQTEEPPPDYSVFDTEHEVYLSPPKVHPLVKKKVQIIAREMKNPRTGRPMGISGYLRLLIHQDMRRRGFNLPDQLFRL